MIEVEYEHSEMADVGYQKIGLDTRSEALELSSVSKRTSAKYLAR